eukprot:802-Heterococcus_DN1.PRE.2
MSSFASMKAIDKAPARCLKPLVDKSAPTHKSSGSGSSSTYDEEISSMWSAYEQRKQQRILARREGVAAGVPLHEKPRPLTAEGIRMFNEYEQRKLQRQLARAAKAAEAQALLAREAADAYSEHASEHADELAEVEWDTTAEYVSDGDTADH